MSQDTNNALGAPNDESTTPKINLIFKINLKKCLENPLQLQEICKYLQGWENISPQDIKVTRFSGAMTNFVFLVENKLVADAVIVRIYSQNTLFFSRQEEHDVFLNASQLGIGPQFLIEFDNGRVEQYFKGTTLTAAMMRDPVIIPHIASSLVEFHVKLYEISSNRNINSRKDMLWERLKQWSTLLQSKVPKLIDSGVSDITDFIAALDDEILQLESKIRSLCGNELWPCVCHNDLQYGNIILSNSIDSTSRIRLIDYEYSAFGDIAFDIANHWCEYMADYHQDKVPHCLFWENRANEEEMMLFCRSYIDDLFDKYSESRLTKIVSFKESGNRNKIVVLLKQRADYFIPVSHLQWAIWGFIQSMESEIDFDYFGYAQERLKMYKACLFKP